MVQYLIEEVKVETKYLDQVITCSLAIFCTLKLCNYYALYVCKRLAIYVASYVAVYAYIHICTTTFVIIIKIHIATCNIKAVNLNPHH